MDFKKKHLNDEKSRDKNIKYRRGNEQSMLALNNSFIQLCRCLIQTAFPEKEKIVLIHFS